LTSFHFPSPFVSVFTSKYHAINWAKIMKGTLIFEIETNGTQLRHVGGQYDYEHWLFLELLIVGDIPEANVVGTFRVDGERDYSGVYKDQLYEGLRQWTEYVLESKYDDFLPDGWYEFETYMGIYGIRIAQRERRLLYPDNNGDLHETQQDAWDATDESDLTEYYMNH
jgi:hypothetical protein